MADKVSLILFCFLTVGTQASFAQLNIPMYEMGNLVWVDRDGGEYQLPMEAQNFASLEISPNGEYLATFITDAGARDLWTYHFDSGEFTRVTSTGRAGFPTWTPDGERLVFASFADGLWQVPADGSAPPTRLTTPENLHHAPNTFAPDGRLIYVDISQTTIDLLLLSLHEPHHSIPLLINSRFTEYASAISPNGKWIAYMSDRTGKQEIHVSDFPGMETTWQVSTDGAQDPRWGRDGRELFIERSGELLVVSVETETTFNHGTPMVLFGGNYQFLPIRSYDISQDGQRFLMSKLVSPN